MLYRVQIWLYIWTLARVPLEQGTCLASKSPSGHRPDNALNRLGSPPGGWVSGRWCLYSIPKRIPTTHFELVLETKTITETITIT